MESKIMMSTDSQLSLVSVKNEPEGQEAEGLNLGGGDGAVAGSEGGSVSVEITRRRKRGRPRKFSMDSETKPLLVSPPLSWTCEKRGIGRPVGSGGPQLSASLGDFAAETAGGSFIPHVVMVGPGEDIVCKLSSFAEKGPRAVCVLSATGVVSSVIICQHGPGSGVLKYEGLFEIIYLSGSFILDESETSGGHCETGRSGSFIFDETSGGHCKTGRLSVSLANPDGCVFGGEVMGSLIACRPTQIVVGSFKQHIFRGLKPKQESAADAGSVLGNSGMERCPFKSAATTEGEGHCATTTSSLLETANGTEAGNTTTVDREYIVKPMKLFSDHGNEDL